MDGNLEPVGDLPNNVISLDDYRARRKGAGLTMAEKDLLEHVQFLIDRETEHGIKVGMTRLTDFLLWHKEFLEKEDDIHLVRYWSGLLIRLKVSETEPMLKGSPLHKALLRFCYRVRNTLMARVVK